MLSVAFRFDLKIQSDELFALNVSVLNGLSLFTFTSGTMMTLLLSHVVLMYHKNATNVVQKVSFVEERRFLCRCPEGSWFEVGSLVANSVADKRKSLLRFVSGSNEKKDFGIIIFNVMILFLLLSSVVLILVGSNTDAFSFEFTGVAGEMVSFVDKKDLKKSHSLLSIASALTSNINSDLSVGDTRLFSLTEREVNGILFLKFVYLFFAFYMPIASVLSLMVLWFVPLNLREQKIVFYSVQIVSCWSALDVFIVCIFGATMEISQFAKFLLKDYCKQVEFLTKETCFSMKTELLPGIYLLLSAVLAVFFTNHFVLRHAEEKINTRESLALLEIEEKE